MTQYAGTAGDFIVGAESLEVKEWSATSNAESLTVTDKASSGYREVLGGIKTLDISASGVYDSTINDGDPPECRIGEKVTGTLELTDGGDSLSGTFLITSFEYSNPVDGVIEYTLSGESDGKFYLPGEATS